MFDIEIKQLTPQDLENVHKIDRSETVSRVYRASEGKLKAYEVSLEVSDDPDFWKKLLSGWKDELAGDGDAYGAFCDGEMVGFAMLKPSSREGQDDIIALYVSAEYRLAGIAKSLHLELESSAKKRGTKTLFVATPPHSSAVDFYLHQGFEFDAGSACSIDDDEQKIPMVKALAKKR